MRHWNKALFGFALLGLTLFLTAVILLMCAPSRMYGKLALFIGGLLISAAAMTLQVRLWRRRQDVSEA